MTDPSPMEPAPSMADRLGRAGRLAAAAGRDRLGQLRARTRHGRDTGPTGAPPAPHVPLTAYAGWGTVPPPYAGPDAAPPAYATAARPASPAPFATTGRAPVPARQPAVPAAVAPPTAVEPATFYATDRPIAYAYGGAHAWVPAPATRPFHRATLLALAVAFIFPPAGLRMADRVRTECRTERLRGQGVAMTAYLFSAINTLGLTVLAFAIAAAFAIGMYRLGSGIQGIGAGLKSIGEFLDWVRRGFS